MGGVNGYARIPRRMELHHLSAASALFLETLTWRRFAPTATAQMDAVILYYERLLRRPPDPTLEENYVAAISRGTMSSADFVRAVARSNEFKDKLKTPPPETSVVTHAKVPVDA